MAIETAGALLRSAASRGKLSKTLGHSGIWRQGHHAGPMPRGGRVKPAATARGVVGPALAPFVAETDRAWASMIYLLEGRLALAAFPRRIHPARVREAIARLHELGIKVAMLTAMRNP